MRSPRKWTPHFIWGYLRPGWKMIGHLLYGFVNFSSSFSGFPDSVTLATPLQIRASLNCFAASVTGRGHGNFLGNAGFDGQFGSELQDAVIQAAHLHGEHVKDVVLLDEPWLAPGLLG